MMPAHHVPEDLLFEYSAGACSEAIGLFTATHLALCPGCRSVVARLDALDGELLEDLQPVPLPPDSFEKLKMHLLETERRVSATPPREMKPKSSRSHERTASAGPVELPGPLRSIVGDYADLKWERLFPGVYQVALPIQHKGMPVRLTRTSPGLYVPRHSHVGRELNLVLAGGFTDSGESYAPGDVSVKDEQDVHSIRIDPGEDCVILAVNEAPLVPVGLFSRLVGKFLHF